ELVWGHGMKAVENKSLHLAAADRVWRRAEGALAALDLQCPGFGFEPRTGRFQHHAMAYGIYASAAALLGLTTEARRGASFLVKNHCTRQGRAGWGLPFAWDAFADGSVNPAETIYGITNAFCV